MKNRLVFGSFLLFTALLGLTAHAAKPTPPPPPSSYQISSANVRLEVDPTYAYRLVEKSSGKILLVKNQTSMVIGGTTYTSKSISNIATTSNSLSGNLTFTVRKTTVNAHVKFTFTDTDTLNVNIWLDANLVQPSSITERFTDQGEHYYGVWETAYGSNIDNRGISGAFSGVDTTVNGVFAASARAPFYLTSNKIGVYVPTVATGSYSFAIAGNTSWTFNVPSINYTVMYGATPKDILAKYNNIAGPSVMPVDWAFSTIWWRDNLHQLTGTPATTSKQLIQLDADLLQSNQIPVSAMWIDRPYGTGTDSTNVSGWGNLDFDSTFQAADEMAQYLEGKGMKLMLWIANKANNRLLTEGTNNNYLFNGYTTRPAADLRNPAAYDWFKGSLNTLMDQAKLADGSTGIKGYKIDRGGEGEMPESVINENTQLFEKLAREGMQARNGNDFFIFSRSANDKSRAYTAVWNGDSSGDFIGMMSSIKNGLRAGLINFPVWGSDSGGYTSVPTQEVFSRWIGFSAYSPMMEILQGPNRNVFYNYSPATIQILADHARTHHDLIPYTRSAVAQSVQSGVPVMRAMALEYPSDPNTATMWDEYMYGPNLLVAPVVTAGATSRSVYLPAGKWINYNNRSTIYSGGQTVTAQSPLAIIPVFAKEGSIIPRGDIVKGNNNWTENWTPSLRIEAFPSSQLASSFSYWTGSAAQIISTSPITDGFSLSSGDLGLGGRLDLYVTRPTSVTLNGQLLTEGTWTYDNAKHLLSVPFASGAIDLQISGSSSIF